MLDILKWIDDEVELHRQREAEDTTKWGRGFENGAMSEALLFKLKVREYMREHRKVEVHWVSGDIDKNYGVYDDLESAQEAVRKWWKDNDYLPPYIRQYGDEDEITWDYGNHTCFYKFRIIKI